LNTSIDSYNSDLTFSVSLDELDAAALAFRIIDYIEEIKSRLHHTSQESNIVGRLLLDYQWSFEAKEVLLLLRDILLNLIKSEQYEHDNLRLSLEVKEYKLKVQALFHEATYHLKASYENKVAGKGVVNEEWQFQENPAPAIIEQIEVISDQVKKIQRSQRKLDQLNRKLKDYRDSFGDIMHQRSARVSAIYELLRELKGNELLNKDRLESSDISKLITTIKTGIDTLNTVSNLSSYEYIVLEDTDKLKLPVSAGNGQMVYKSVEVLSEVSGWTAFNVTPSLKSVDAKLHSFTDRVATGLQQIMNRLKVKLDSGKDNPTVDRLDVLNALDKIIHECQSEVVPETIDKIKEIENLLDTYLRSSQLYNEEFNFLPISSMAQVSGLAEKSLVEQRYSVENIKQQVKKVSGTLFSKYTNAEQLSAPAYINKVLSFNPESDENALFLRKGFLGSSFTLDREDIFRRINSHYELWDQGYGGALLLQGGHGTGRSTILEMIPVMHPDITSHHITVGQKIDVNGHKITVQKELITIVNFIVKHSNNQKCIITIDDIEQYTNSPANMYKLIKELFYIIQKKNQKIYFAMSIHRFLYEQIFSFMKTNHIFTETISTDYMAPKAIEEALLTRAYAVAHQDDLTKRSDQYYSKAKMISKKSRNNVGRAMQLWCMFNGDYQNDNGNARFKTLVLENEELLKLLFRNGDVYEPELRSMLNKVDATNLKSEIESLIRIKLLVRPQKGYIKVNPYLQSTIEAIIS